MSIPLEVEEAKPQYHPSFDDEDADTVISSIDHTLFRLPHVTLGKSSGYFRKIFDPDRDSASNKSPEGTSCDSVPSTDQIYKIPFPTVPLERVLLLISGLPIPIETLSFEEVEAMIGVTTYLDTPGPLSTLRACTLQQFRQEPILVYGLGMKLGWNEIAQEAAELTLPIVDIFSTINKNSEVIEKQLARLPTAFSLVTLHRMHQRRKDLFRQHLNDRSQFQLTCGLCCDPTYWRLLVARLIDELSRDCSGTSILAPGGLDEWPETRNCWKGCPCRNVRCDYRHGLANKSHTMRKIRRFVESLPKDLWL